MVSLKFVFDKEKVAAAGLTEDELLQPMREHAEKYGINEPEKGLFEKSGDDALCVIAMFIPDIVRKDNSFIGFLSKWTLNADGEEEDCIAETYNWYKMNEPDVVLGGMNTYEKEAVVV